MKIISDYNIVHRSMELAMSAKEPHNHFFLLRALFRSIGGGKHDLLYREFLPLLPNLLEGKISCIPSFHCLEYSYYNSWSFTGVSWATRVLGIS